MSVQQLRGKKYLQYHSLRSDASLKKKKKNSNKQTQHTLLQTQPPQIKDRVGEFLKAPAQTPTFNLRVGSQCRYLVFSVMFSLTFDDGIWLSSDKKKYQWIWSQFNGR